MTILNSLIRKITSKANKHDVCSYSGELHVLKGGKWQRHWTNDINTIPHPNVISTR